MCESVCERESECVNVCVSECVSVCVCESECVFCRPCLVSFSDFLKLK